MRQEFRTPLQGIMGVASTVLNDLSPEEGDGALADGWSTVLASSRLLLTLINNILDLGKMDADKMAEIELSSVPVYSAIRESIEFCTHFAALSETKLVFDTPERELTMLVNRTRLQQVGFHCCGRQSQLFVCGKIILHFQLTADDSRLVDSSELALECHQIRIRLNSARVCAPVQSF